MITIKQIIGKLALRLADEVHQSGWNACASCAGVERTHLIVPCLNSSNIYAIDVADPKDLKLFKVLTSDNYYILMEKSHYIIDLKYEIMIRILLT